MDFIKNWWLWILLTVIVIALGVVQLVWTSGYIKGARSANDMLQREREKIEKHARRARNNQLPTRGDVDQAKGVLDRIRAEGYKTAQAWADSSKALDRMHDISPTEFSPRLSQLCQENCKMLAKTTAETLGIEISDDSSFLVCPDLTKHDISDFGKQYRTPAETLLEWRHYIILKRLHEIIAQTKVEIDTPVALQKKDDMGEVKTEWSEGKRFRMVEFFSPVEFGNLIRSTKGITEKELGGTTPTPPKTHGRSGGEEESAAEIETYHDIYPVKFKIRAHISVVQKLMDNLLKVAVAGDGVAPEETMLFVPKQALITRLTDAETRPADETRERRAADMSYAPFGNRLEYWHEPPVVAELQYDIYHFRFPPERLGKEEAGENGRTE